MRHTLIRTSLALATLFTMATALPSCVSTNHCPAIAGTGNSATHKTGFLTSRKNGCAGVKGTGNYKPKVKNKREDGLMSAKMEKQMAKAQAKKTSPIESRKLSMDQ